MFANQNRQALGPVLAARQAELRLQGHSLEQAHEETIKEKRAAEKAGALDLDQLIAVLQRMGRLRKEYPDAALEELAQLAVQGDAGAPGAVQARAQRSGGAGGDTLSLAQLERYPGRNRVEKCMAFCRERWPHDSYEERHQRAAQLAKAFALAELEQGGRLQLQGPGGHRQSFEARRHEPPAPTAPSSPLAVGGPRVFGDARRIALEVMSSPGSTLEERALACVRRRHPSLRHRPGLQRSYATLYATHARAGGAA